MELLLRKKIKCDQHNVASPLYFFFKPIINNLKSFFSGTSEVVFFIFFLLEHRRLKDVFLGAPSEDRPQPRILSRSSSGSTSGCVPEETHIDSDYDWKTSQVLKVRQIFLCSDCWIISFGFRFRA